MKGKGKRALAIILLTVSLVLLMAVLMSCQVGDDATDSPLPTGLGQGISDPDPPPINPNAALSIIPAGLDVAVLVGVYYPGGWNQYFYVRGGSAPYYWSHSDPYMGYLTPVDEFNDGVDSKLRYTFKPMLYGTAGTDEDTIIVTDGEGNTATIKITVTASEEEEEEVPELVITPSTQTIANGSSINLTASGGVPPYSWSQSDPSASIDPEGTTVTLDASGVADTEITVIVTDSEGNSASATITVGSP